MPSRRASIEGSKQNLSTWKFSYQQKFITSGRRLAKANQPQARKPNPNPYTELNARIQQSHICKNSTNVSTQDQKIAASKNDSWAITTTSNPTK
jgi:hypothetical protein